MDNYKEKLQRIALSEPIYKKIYAIGDRHNLHIDQAGEMAAEIRDVIMEITPASKFIDDLKVRLEVSEEVARDIALDVDKEIFKSIKSLLQTLTEVEEAVKPKSSQQPSTPAIAPIEKAGEFNVIKPDASHSPQYNDHTLSREEVLADLEQIDNLQPEKSENYVEHLIPAPATPTPPPQTPPAPPKPRPVVPPPQQPEKPEQRKYESDPYREAI
jgi:hypothetical protein